MLLNENLRAIRKKWGESQEEFATRLGMSRSNLSKVESGEFELSLLNCRLLSRLTGIPMERLMDERIEQDEVPALPIGEGGEMLSVAKPAREQGQAVEAGLWDLRALVDRVRELDRDFRDMKENAVSRMDMIGLVTILIERLEGGLDESVYKDEKELLIGRLATLLEEAKK